MVGAAVTGYDVVANKLEEWDSGEEYYQGPELEILNDSDKGWDQSPIAFEGNSLTYEDELLSPPNKVESRTEESTRHALIGLIFKTQRRIGSGFGLTIKIIGFLGQKSKPLINSISRNRGLNPARKRFGSLIVRGEEEVNQWIEIGRQEEVNSRVMLNNAFYETIDFWIEYFAENQEVVELVTSQSVSFAEEIVEEVRERTVSADNLLEGFLRHILRRPPRTDLPIPSEVVISQVVNNKKLPKG